MADNEVIIDVVARLDKAEAAIKRFEGTAKTAGEKAGSEFGGGFSETATKGFKALAIAAAAALAGLTVVFKKGVDAAIEQENATNALNQALARTGQFSAEAAKDLDNFASALQKNSVFADDVILQNAALIQSLGGLSTQGLKQATQAAADLSAALGIDLRTASQLVGKAAAGEVGTFGRYGIAIKEGANASETFANALTKINAQFGGAAAAQANTFGGSVEKAKNAFGDLLEEIGNLIIKSPEIAVLFRFIGKAVESATEAVKGFAGDGGLRGIILTGLDVYRFFTSVLGPVIEVAVNSFVALGKSIGAAAAALVQLLSGDFSAALTTIKEGVIDELSFDNVFQTAGTDAGLAMIDGLTKAVETAAPLAAAQIKNNTAPMISEAFNDISFNGLLNSFRMTVTQMNELAKSVIGQIRGTFISGFSSAFQAIGSALVKGENAFAAFGKAILGMFGDIAIQLGQFYLTLGLANLFLNPAAAAGQLAGGAALLVLGGALKALAGGGAGAQSTAGSATTSAAAAPVGTSTSNLQETEATAPGTAVTVNVQGNILDRRETGLEIAQIINESFSSGGIVMARGAFV
jgi:hypothetical protein